MNLKEKGKKMDKEMLRSLSSVLLLLCLLLPPLLLSDNGRQSEYSSDVDTTLKNSSSSDTTALTPDEDTEEDVFPAHIDTALTYFGAKERDRENYGPDIKKFLASVGLNQGYPYCAAFVSYCLDVAEQATRDGQQARVSYPKVRSAVAQDFITDRSVDAKKVRRQQVDIPSGWVHVMKKGDTPYGHNGFVLFPWSGATGIVIDANTSLGMEGMDDRDGQGVWIRKRTIYPTCYFCVDYFTPVEYEN